MAVALVGYCPFVNGQWDDDGFGNIHCDPLLPSASVTIGDGTSVNMATLNVRGDQLPVDDAFSLPSPDPTSSLATLRTDVPAGYNQNWSMVRNNVQQGRLYHGAEFNWFAVQAPQPHGDGTVPGILWLENAETDGIMIRANGLAVNPVNGYPLRTNGFISVGHRGLVPAVA